MTYAQIHANYPLRWWVASLPFDARCWVLENLPMSWTLRRNGVWGSQSIGFTDGYKGPRDLVRDGWQ